MTFKTSCPPTTLHILQSLQPRMYFSTTQLKQYHNLQKGFEGEKKLNRFLTEHLSSNYLVLTRTLSHIYKP